MRVSPPAIYRAVGEVARVNRIANPDRIRPGQAIDLSAIVPAAKPNERSVGLSDDGAVAEEGVSTGSIVHGLKAFIQSLAGRFTSSFGPRADPVTGSRIFHAGVDIKLPAGSFIYPALPGRVIFSGRTRGYGNLIILAHAGGFTTSYGHNSANLIPAGVVVDQEMPIAVVGASGKATGPHLHFEVRRDGHPINPVVGSLELGDQDAGDDP
jgi:murein DD-endopeptidase MepM/ murein hydrolase activator NlpD